MAPRGRTRKRLSRMDAAVDAMVLYGFDSRLVQKIVKQLLKVYGDDGWAFIEEFGYKELIDAILRGQESNHEDTTKIEKGVDSQDERAEDPALQSSIGPSGTHVYSTNEAGNTVGETSCSELGPAAAEPTHKELCSNKQDIGSTEISRPLSVEGDGNRWRDIWEDQTSTQKETPNSVCSDGGNSEDQMQPGTRSQGFAPPPTSSPSPVNYLKVQSGSSPHASTPPPASSPRPINHLSAPADHHLPSTKLVSLQPPRRRFPCYGWIESDGEEDDEFIQLAPMKTTMIA